MMNQISKFSIQIGSIWIIFHFASGSKVSLGSAGFDRLFPSLPHRPEKRVGWWLMEAGSVLLLIALRRRYVFYY